MNAAHLSAAPIDIAQMFAMAHDPAAGAVVIFSGETRNHSNGKMVQYLEYEAKESMAQKMIASIVDDAKQKWSLPFVFAQHRTGQVAVSECAVLVITASAHRAEAYAANRYIIDRIKHEAPIWKCEYFQDGTHAWGGNCNCAVITGDPHKHVYEFS